LAVIAGQVRPKVGARHRAPFLQAVHSNARALHPRARSVRRRARVVHRRARLGRCGVQLLLEWVWSSLAPPFSIQCHPMVTVNYPSGRPAADHSVQSGPKNGRTAAIRVYGWAFAVDPPLSFDRAPALTGSARRRSPVPALWPRPQLHLVSSKPPSRILITGFIASVNAARCFRFEYSVALPPPLDCIPINSLQIKQSFCIGSLAPRVLFDLDQGRLQWVNRITLTVGRPLPIYADQRTSSDRPGMSGWCQTRKNSG
jgi:hypothetical protein